MSKDVEPDCVRSGIWTYINIDIFNKYGYGIFGCGYGITPEEKKTPEGFKTYIHKFPGGFVYLNKIKYNKIDQTGFKNIKSCHTDVEAYYWSHDEDNILPLAIRVTKTKWYLGYYYHYYEHYKNSGIGSNNWRKYSIGKDISTGLTTISNENPFNKVVILNLSQTNNNGKYEVNGETTYDINKSVKIQVTGPENEPSADYKKFTHNLVGGGGHMRILSTKLGKEYKPFKESVLGTTYESASVFYSKDDNTFKKPLILHLGTSEDTYYRLDGGEKWIHDKSIRSNNLGQNLANLSGAHIIDVSETKNTYRCSSPSCGKNIEVETFKESKYDYTKHRHHMSGSFSVSSFVGSSKQTQTGLSSPTGVTEVNVFWYPNDGSPLLINFSDKWFMKTKVDNTWKEVTESTIKPNHADDKNKIQKLLIEAASPEVTIKLEQVSGSYQSDNENINIAKSGVDNANGYSKITHDITKKTFIIKGITHVNKSQTVKGSATFPTYPIDNIAVFYVTSDPKISKPLLLELKLQGDTTYKYYEKTGKANEWNLFRSGETTQLTGDPLKKKLDELYVIHFPSNLTAILGASFGSLGATGGLVGLGIWKGPAIVSFLIARL